MSLPPGSKLGLVAGGGQMPLRVVTAARAAGHEVYALLIEGWADPADFGHVPHDMVKVGAVDDAYAKFRAQGVRHLVMCGRAHRPSLTSLGTRAAAC